MILALGYLLGSVKIKGLNLGTAGVLIVALVFGLVCSACPTFSLGGTEIVLYDAQSKSIFSFLSGLGTAMFITAVGLTAGPKFFRGFGRSSLPSLLMGLITVSCGAVICSLLSILDPNVDASLGLGLMTGAMTSTPGFSSAMDCPAVNADTLAAGYGIAYLFGILGKVLFMQLTPRIVGADMDSERRAFTAVQEIAVPEISRPLRSLDGKGFCPFVLTAALGLAIGSISIPGIGFSLGASGGTLASGIIIGHFRHISSLDLRVPKATLDFFRELGLALFLVGAGVPGGVSFSQHVRPVYFLYGAAMTLLPMIIGYLAARYIFRLRLLNALGSIAGGLTSTPALGALISASGTDEVISAYAAAYPVALVCMVLAAKILPAIL